MRRDAGRVNLGIGYEPLPRASLGAMLRDCTLRVLPRADRLYVTYIHADIAGDTRFPPIDAREWREQSREDREADAKNPYPLSFVCLERVG